MNPIHVVSSCFFNPSFNTNPPPTSRSSELSRSCNFSLQNPVCTPPLPHKCHMPHPSQPLHLITRIMYGDEYNHGATHYAISTRLSLIMPSPPCCHSLCHLHPAATHYAISCCHSLCHLLLPLIMPSPCCHSLCHLLHPAVTLSQ